MKRVVGVAAAVVVALAVAGVVWLQVGNGVSGQPAKAAKATVAAPAAAKVPIATKTYTLQAGGLKRSYEVIAPVKAPPKSAPIIVMLSGIYSTVADEVGRDYLVPYANYDMAEIVYPVAYDTSWNAIGCCGVAAAKNVDDLAFLKALEAKVDPGHARQIYLVGYSNGARMAYRVACDEPALFDGYASVKGGPTPGCIMRKPVSMIQLAAVNDPEVPYKPAPNGKPSSQTPMTTLVSDLRTVDKCTGASTGAHSGNMTLTTWTACAGGTRVGFALWSSGVHSFPRPPVSVPAASQVIWSFFMKSPIAPLPK
jgi:polyhydroxybutyrate depolymerase